MKVLHVITTIDFGGAEKQLVILVQAQVKRGMSVEVIPLKGEALLLNKFLDCGATVNTSLLEHNSIRQIRILRKINRNNKNSILHAHLPQSEIFAAISKHASQKLIISRHNSEKFFPMVPRPLSSWISRLVLSRCLDVIAISKSVRNYLLDAREINQNQNISVVYYGIDRINCKRINNGQKEFVNDYFTIGTVARLVKQKNLETLLKAFAELREFQNNCQLIIVGEGPLKPKLVALSRKLKLDNSIIWHSKSENIFEIMERLDLFVLPSLYEGFGLVYLEAMCAGIPILSSKNNAAIEIFGIDNEILFNLKDHKELFLKMKDLMNDDRATQNLKTCRVIIKNFDHLKMETAIYKTYKRVTN